MATQLAQTEYVPLDVRPCVLRPLFNTLPLERNVGRMVRRVGRMGRSIHSRKLFGRKLLHIYVHVTIKLTVQTEGGPVRHRKHKDLRRC